MRQLKACGVFVYQGEPIQSFLLMEHADRWDLPKGHMEPGETEIECALRELVEETGIRQQQLSIDPDFRFETSYPVWPKRLGGEECLKTTVLFLGCLQEDVSVRITEHKGYHWHPWQPPHRIQEATIDPLLAELERHLSGKSAAGD